ncbi:hypothetical protein FXO38_05033 [Capsicum annuum]|uniref:ABC transporter domain-containing protein n=1 Tax=Capsicum annuum TaxID=4072 RepID=A0A2G2YMB2_CAPAN|nr:hypothetical protein FXO38_05033 [Capsicum annuum]PHT70882.1 hypothetical protein T459_25986 [Capsicum annuum]
MLENYIILVGRLEQSMHIPSEPPEIIQGNRPDPSCPYTGKLEIIDLKKKNHTKFIFLVRYQPKASLVLQGISCIIEVGYKIGIIGRTGSGKKNLISSLFLLVEPIEVRMIIDGLNISTIGILELQSSLSIIPQDPTLFSGTVRYNLDPLSEHTDQDIWEVTFLYKHCQNLSFCSIASFSLLQYFSFFPSKGLFYCSNRSVIITFYQIHQFL